MKHPSKLVIIGAFALFTALTSFAAPPAAITQQPASQNVPWGSNATFTVTIATGTTPSFQWFFNDTAITPIIGGVNTNFNSFTVTNVQPEAMGEYLVHVINAGGTIVSSVAFLNCSNVPSAWTSYSLNTGNIGGADVDV